MSREIDALIAEHVMGWEVRQGAYNDWYGLQCDHPRVPDYSTNIADAFEVVEKSKPYDITSRTYYTPKKHSSYSCILYEKGEGVMAYAETLPMAICLAALKAKNRGAA